jgi:FkbM family methyltransferase
MYISFLREQAWNWHKLRAIRLWTDRDHAASKFYSQFIQPGETCFDIGANRGNRTKIFKMLGARVIACEPQPRCASLLRRAFTKDSSVTVVEAACGDYQGRAQLKIARYDGLSSLSADWITAVTATGRFGDMRWDEVADVAVTTLDSLITAYGGPTFIKIDVEGSEVSVLRGLSRPVRCLSFEFAPEFGEAALESIRRLTALGFQRFNFSAEESMRLTYPEWLNADQMIGELMNCWPSATFFGDVYARWEGC